MAGTDPKKRPVKDLSRDALAELCKAQGQPSFRAKQIAEWLYEKNVANFSDMTNLPASFREYLAKNFMVDSLTMMDFRECDEGLTRKCLFAIDENDCVETVAMKTKGSGQDKTTLCISTQVGCAMNCSFCASALDGFKRDLSPAEIVDQALMTMREFGGILGNIMIMGMGEPLLNISGLRAALDAFTSSPGLAMSPRRITVSTAGIVPGIDQLSEFPQPPDLAISLHACDDGARSRLMPVNKKYPTNEVIDAARRYRSNTKADVTLEYLMLSGVNDAANDARKLAKIAVSIPANVNLLPFNDMPVATKRGLRASAEDAVEGFQDILRCESIRAFVRNPRGREVVGACGQLRLQRRNTNGDWQ
ncbi:23S rRNA (adenine(2503)-C(2))-methyltransferase RlmN [Candidatus Hydrogenedentota bacterium]